MKWGESFEPVTPVLRKQYLRFLKIWYQFESQIIINVRTIIVKIWH